MNVIFMGTPDYAQKILQTLIQTKGINVVAVFTQPDKPVGRKKVMTPSPVKVSALDYNIPVLQPSRLRDEEVIKDVLEIECDYIVVAAYGQILPREILEHAPCINLHASILPQYRGASPIQQTLLHGDKETGVTAMLMEEGLDTGDILKIVNVPVHSDEMLLSLFEKLTDIAAALTVDVLENFDSLTPVKQTNAQASYCKKITKADGAITLDNAEDIYNKFRAFTPWPGIYLSSGLKLKDIKLQNRDTVYDKPGTILEKDKKSIVIACKVGSLRVYKVQPQSKKEMDILSYINGKRLEIEDIIS